MIMAMIVFMTRFMVVVMMIVVMLLFLVVGPLAGAVAQLLEYRGIDAHGALRLQGCMGNVKTFEEELLYFPQDTGLVSLVFRLHVHVR